MNAFGLTGNIGCGKSTVASMLSKYPDVLTIDCDRLAKEIISCGKHRQEINAILGQNVYQGGTADFHKIAAIIFLDKEKKRLIEQLTHPLVWTVVQGKVNSAGNGKICVVESAIIFETNSESRFSAIILAVCNASEQLRRLREIRGMDEKQIQLRIAQQMPQTEKENGSQLIVHTDCNLSELPKRVDDLYQILKQWKGVI